MYRIGNAQDGFDYVFEPDGNLATEFAAMEAIYQAEVERRSNDPFWCLLEEDESVSRRRTFGSGQLDHMRSSKYWECLDIASASTLGLLDHTEINLACPLGPDDCVWTFQELTNEQRNETLLYGSADDCSGKVVGDGTINSLDIAVLLYSQFGEGPYDEIFLPGQTPGLYNPFTTFFRDFTAQQCGNGLNANEYQLQIATDFCKHGPAPAFSLDVYTHPTSAPWKRHRHICAASHLPSHLPPPISLCAPALSPGVASHNILPLAGLHRSRMTLALTPTLTPTLTHCLPPQVSRATSPRPLPPIRQHRPRGPQILVVGSQSQLPSLLHASTAQVVSAWASGRDMPRSRST